MKIAVTGASGYIGSHFVQFALNQSCDVSALAFPDLPRDVPVGERVSWLQGSINDREVIAELLSGADVVIHLASFVHQQTVTEESSILCRRTNVDGTRVVLEVASAQPQAPFIVFMSTRAVYTPSDQICDEQSPCEPNTLYGRTKLEAERILMDGIRQGKVRGCILRPSIVYGPGAPGNMVRLLKLVDRGIVPLINGGANQKSIVYIDNMAHVIWACLQANSVTNGHVYNVSDMPLITMREIVERSAVYLGKSPTIVNIPYRLAQIIVSLHDLSLGTLRGKVYRPTLRAFAESGAVTHQRLADATGYQQPVSIEDGLRRMADWYQSTAARNRT